MGEEVVLEVNYTEEGAGDDNEGAVNHQPSTSKSLSHDDSISASSSAVHAPLSVSLQLIQLWMTL